MPPETESSEGMLDSLRRLGDHGLALLQNRVELFGVELEEQKLRLLRVLSLVAAGAILANLALVLGSIAIVVAFGPGARLPVLIGLTLLYALAAVVVVIWIRKETRSAPPPFAGTVSELEKDREWLNSRN
jgi:uncharacterized membrane protein YqjE